MLDSRWTKALRDLTQHGGRSALVVLAVALGLFAAGTVVDAWALVQRATENGYAASLPVSATLKMDRVSPALLEQVRALPEVATARARRTQTAALQTPQGWRAALVFALDDFNPAAMARLRPEVGDWPPADNTLWIERSSLGFAGAELGESMQLALGGKGDAAQRLVLRGIVRDVSLAPGWMENIVYLFATPATLARIGAPEGFNELQFRVRDGHASRDDVRRVGLRIKQLAERSGAQVLGLDVPVPGEHIHAAQMDSLLFTQGAFGVLALLACGFLVVNLFSAMLTGQARQIGVMKTLGGSTRQLASIYLGQALLLGGAASLVALPLAAWAGREYGALKAEMLNLPIAGESIPLWALALQVAVGALLPVLAAWWPVRRACRMTVGAALRDIGIVAPGSPLALRRLWLPGGWARPVLLSLANAFRRRQRMALTLLALAAACAVQLGASNLRAAVKASVDSLFASQAYDFTLRLADPQPAAALEAKALMVAGVQVLEAWRGQRAAQWLDDGSEVESFAVIGLPVPSATVHPTVTQGRALQPGDDQAIVVSRRLIKEQPGLLLGGLVTLKSAGHERVWQVVGIVDAGAQALAYAPRATLDRLAGDSLATALAVTAASRNAAVQLDTLLALRAALQAAGMPVASSQMKGESRKVIEDHLLMVVEFLAAMGWVMTAVGTMGLAGAMGLAVLERQREIGVMRAIGASRGAIAAMVQIEGLVIVSLAWLAALPISVLASALLGEAFGRVMFTVPLILIPEWGAALRALGLMLVVSALACGWPMRQAMRISPARSLSYE